MGGALDPSTAEWTDMLLGPAVGDVAGAVCDGVWVIILLTFGSSVDVGCFPP